MRTRTILSALLLVLVGVHAYARKITFDDLYSLPRCQDPQISPDGLQITFVLRETDLSSNSRASHLWIMNSDGSHTRQLTFGASNDSHPRWAPDGKSILFLSNRGEGTQVWSLPLRGGEARPVTNAACGVSEFECSPTGNDVLLVSRIFPDCQNDSCNQARLEDQRSHPNRPRLYTKLPVRRYNHWEDSRINRLFLVNLGDGTIRSLYDCDFDLPTSMLGGDRDYAVSPDGYEICFSMSTDSMPVLGINNDLYTVAAQDGEPVRITDNPALDNNPRYSPDGKYISYEATARFGYESDQRDIVIYNRQTKNRENITADFDRSVGDLIWGPDSKYIYFTAIEHGLNKVWRVDVQSHEVELLLGDAVYGSLRLSPDGSFLVVNRSLSDEPYELYRYDLKSSRLTRLTDFTKDIVSDLDMNRAEDFWFVGTMGDSIHGFLTKPPNFNPSGKYPFVLLIHGGPQWCWLGDFNYYGWNTQLTAAQGYVVAQIDPHGSSGYGIKFKEYISGSWGRGDYEDLMTGISYLIGEYTFIDTTRMGALGRSYGGFMINWICGHTDRFACLIGIDGTYNHVSFYGSTDELWFPEWDINGTPWSNPGEYAESSPVTYAGNFKTPTMLIHGQRDYRVDLSEGLQMFTALQRMGVPSQFLCFPNESHSVHGLANLRYVYKSQFEWLARWLAP